MDQREEPEFFEDQKGGDQNLHCSKIFRALGTTFLFLMIYTIKHVHISSEYFCHAWATNNFDLITVPSNVYGRGMFFHRGDQNLFTEPKGGPAFFFLGIGGLEKIGDRPSQTDAPLPVKNDIPLSLLLQSEK